MMPKIFSVLSATLLAFCLNAQTAKPAAAVNDSTARQATKTLTDKYGLNADQAKSIYRVMLRKQNNLGEIAGLKSSDPALYVEKCNHVQRSTLKGIRDVLQSKHQVDLYNKTQTDMRILRRAREQSMLRNKAARLDIDLALLDIYSE